MFEMFHRALVRTISSTVGRVVPAPVSEWLLTIFGLWALITPLLLWISWSAEVLAFALFTGIAAILLAKLLEYRQKIIDFLSQVWLKLVTKFIEIRTKVRTTLLMIGAIITGKLLEWYTAITTKIAAIKTWIEGKYEEWTTLGADLLGGLWHGLKTKMREIREWLEGSFDDLVGLAKRVLGIESPSRVFAGIGEQMLAGLRQGLNLAPFQAQVQAGLSGFAGAAVGAGGRTVVLHIEGGLSFPNVRDGRDADGVYDQLNDIADQAGSRGTVPGGLMGG